MSRSTRFVVACAVVSTLVVIVAELWVESLLTEPARRLIERELSAATGLEAKIPGAFDLDIVPLRIESMQLTLTADGQSDPVLSIEEVELHLDPWLLLFGVVTIDELQITGARLNLRSGDLPAPDVESLVSPSDSGKDVGIDFRIERIELRELRVEYRDGASAAIRVLVIDELSLAAHAPDAAVSVSLSGSFEGSPMNIKGEIGAAAELLRPTAPYPISLQVRLPETGVEVEVAGHLSQPTRLVGIDVAVSIIVPELSDLLSGLPAGPAADTGLPPLGSVRITGHIRDPNGILAIEDLRVESPGDSRVRLAATGSVGDLLKLRDVEFDVQLDADGLEFLQPFVDVPLPAIDSIELVAHVSDRDGRLAVQGQVRASAAAGELTVDISGSVADLRNFEEFEVAFDVQARDLALVGETLGLELPLPALGPVTAQGKLRGRVGALGVEEFTARIGESNATWVELDGSMKDLANLADVHLVARFHAADLRHLHSFLERAPPDVGPLWGGATLSDRDGSLGIHEIRVTGGQQETFTIDFSGGIHDLREVDEISFDVAIEAASLETVGALLGNEWPAIGPVSFTGHVTGSDENLSARGTMRLAQSEFAGTASAAFVAGTRPSLRARIESPHIRLAQIGLSPGTPPSDPEATGDDAWGSWWSGSQPLPFERLRAIDADIELRADRVTGAKGLELLDLNLALQLDDGHLLIREAGAGIEGGSLRATLRVDARTPDPRLALHLDANDVNLGGWLPQLEKGTESTGMLDMSIALESRGHSPAALRANLHGDLSAVVRDGSVASDYGDAFVKNLLRLSLPDLLSRDREGFGCVVIEFEVERGIAVARRLVVDTENVVVIGSGEIDIGADAFDLLLSPTARKPGVLSLSAEVEVTGPLAQPVFRARHRTIPGRLAHGFLSNLLAPVNVVVQPLRAKTEQLCRQGLAPPTRPAEWPK